LDIECKLNSKIYLGLGLSTISSGLPVNYFRKIEFASSPKASAKAIKHNPAPI
jgi:hypothetical protein